MIRCTTKEEFNFWKQYYTLFFGSVLVNERRKIIYLPDDKLYQKRYLNRNPFSKKGAKK